jgi:membrane protease YdiL (CAAX protease family)
MSRPRVVREIVLYLLITYALALGIALALPDANINKLFSVLAPTVAVLILTVVATPSGQRRALWRSIGLGRRRGPASVWLLALGIPVLLTTLAYGAALALGVGKLGPITITAASGGEWVLNLLVTLAGATLIIAGEEIGWRGFLLPRFQRLTGKRRAAVVTGFFHGCFHLPLILFASTYDAEGSRWFVAPVVVLTVTAAGVFYAYVKDRSGSTWAAAVGHGAANTFFDLGDAAVTATGSTAALAYVSGESGLATMGAVMAVAVVLLTRSRRWRADSGAAAPASRHEKLSAAV